LVFPAHQILGNSLAICIVLLVTVPIVVLRPLELLHEAEALQIEFAYLWVTEFPPHPVKSQNSAC
jgi:hypothetical protein